MKSINVYHTHIEVKPYEKGELPKIEKFFSIWDDPTHSFLPLGYEVFNNTLYLPRGANLTVLQKNIGANVINISKEPDSFDKTNRYTTLYEPRDVIQQESCDFLTGEGNFKYTRKASQLSLNLDTGDGKTFCAIKSIIDLRMKSIIITHIDDIKQQWFDSFLKMTDVPEEKLINISGSNIMNKILDGDIEGDYYFVNHQTLNAYFRANGFDKLREFFKSIKCGIKVIDEAHKAFKNTLRIDMFSNVKKSFYLTANFSRSDNKERILFEKAFSSTVRFGEETKNYECKRKHIIYIPVFYDSRASQEDIASMKNYYGFSATSFIDYALLRDTSESLEETLIEIYNKARSVEGRILITSPKKSSCDLIVDIIKKIEPDVNIGTIHSNNKPDINERNKEECDVISSTLKSCGTGSDINGLRCLINTEPHNSDIATNQICGRLREYSPTEDTYYFDLIDISVPRCYEMYKSRLKYLSKKVKKIVIHNKK